MNNGDQFVIGSEDQLSAAAENQQNHQFEIEANGATDDPASDTQHTTKSLISSWWSKNVTEPLVKTALEIKEDVLLQTNLKSEPTETNGSKVADNNEIIRQVGGDWQTVFLSNPSEASCLKCTTILFPETIRQIQENSEELGQQNIMVQQLEEILFANISRKLDLDEFVSKEFSYPSVEFPPDCDPLDNPFTGASNEFIEKVPKLRTFRFQIVPKKIKESSFWKKFYSLLLFQCRSLKDKCTTSLSQVLLEADKEMPLPVVVGNSSKLNQEQTEVQDVSYERTESIEDESLMDEIKEALEAD